MKITYIKYIDPKKNSSNFKSHSQVMEMKCEEIEAVGFDMGESDKAVAIGMQKVGDNYTQVLVVPKVQIMEQRKAKKDEYHYISYVDAKGTKNGLWPISDLKYRVMEVEAVGFKIGEDRIAQEKTFDNWYRTILVIPKGLII